MKKLLILDQKNYTDDMPEFEKHSVRAIIIRDGKIATQKGAAGEYKILGGGMDAGEDFAQSIQREVQEESGLLVIPESIQEIGEIEEKRRDRFDPHTVFHCHSYFFRCEVQEEMTHTSMTQSEVEKGYHLEWATPEEIIAANQNFVEYPWIYRDTEFIKRFIDGTFGVECSYKNAAE